MNVVFKLDGSARIIPINGNLLLLKFNMVLTDKINCIRIQVFG